MAFDLILGKVLTCSRCLLQLRQTISEWKDVKKMQRLRLQPTCRAATVIFSILYTILQCKTFEQRCFQKQKQIFSSMTCFSSTKFCPRHTSRWRPRVENCRVLTLKWRPVALHGWHQEIVGQISNHNGEPCGATTRFLALSYCTSSLTLRLLCKATPCQAWVDIGILNQFYHVLSIFNGRFAPSLAKNIWALNTDHLFIPIYEFEYQEDSRTYWIQSMICPQISFLCHFWDVRFFVEISSRETHQGPERLCSTRGTGKRRSWRWNTVPKKLVAIKNDETRSWAAFF